MAHDEKLFFVKNMIFHANFSALFLPSILRAGKKVLPLQHRQQSDSDFSSKALTAARLTETETQVEKSEDERV